MPEDLLRRVPNALATIMRGKACEVVRVDA
jgi:hypothetical protein